MLLKAVIRITKAATVGILAVVLLSDASLACRSSRSPVAVLLEVVPTEALDAPVIARVVIKDLYPAVARMQNDYQPGYATAEVIKAIKGVEVGDVIKIRTDFSVCSTSLYWNDIGRDGFVAGEFNPDHNLVGFWHLRYSRSKGQR